MISAIRKWWRNRAKYSEPFFQQMCDQYQEQIMRETSLQFRDMRLQLAQKENIINELKASKSSTSKPKRVQRRKQSRKGS